MNIDELFDFTCFSVDREPHIVLDRKVCAACANRACTTACPANCYSWLKETGEMTFVYDGCLECGTCYIVCEPGAFLKWGYPRGGFGVSYRMT